ACRADRARADDPDFHAGPRLTEFKAVLSAIDSGGARVPGVASLRIDRLVGLGANQRADIVGPRHAREPAVEDLDRAPLAELQGGFEDAALRRVDEPGGQIRFGDLFRGGL